MKIRRPHLLVALLSLPACTPDSTGPGEPVTEVRVSPESPSIDVGLTVQFFAQALNASGQALTGLPVTWASNDQAVAAIDADGLVTGISAGVAAITATIGGVSDSEVLVVEPSQCLGRVTVTLDAGQFQSYDGDTCLLLPSGQSGDRYRVAIIRPTLIEDAADVPNVMLVVSPILSAAASLAMVPPVTPDPQAGTLAVPGLSSALPKIDGTRIMEDVRMRARTRQFHYELRRRERELGLYDMPLIPNLPNSAPAMTSHPDPPARDDLFLDLDCSLVVSRPVILIDFDDDLAIYQDSVQWSTAPLGTNATGQLLSYHRDYIRDMVTQYWGAVSDIDGNGRVILTTTTSLPESAASGVFSGDFVTPASCASSNEGEVVYWDLSQIFNLADTDPSYAALSILAHELKHVVSLYHSARRGSFHSIWIEEGTAEISQNMSSRIAWAATGGPAIGAEINRADILEAVEQNGDELTPEMWGVIGELADLIVTMNAQPNSLLTDPDGASDFHSFRALTWQWFRFIGDAWGGAATPFADAPLFLAMTDSLSPAGPAAATQGTGRSFDQLFEDLVVAISVHKTGQTAAREFSTWDLASATDIFAAPTEVAPPGTYPWPVTMSLSGSSGAGFVAGVYSCPPKVVNGVYVLAAVGERCAIGPSGMRFHDFVSSGTGAGAQILVTGADSGRIIITRLR